MLVHKLRRRGKKVCLGVNIDHVATLRQARGGIVPSPRMAALEAIRGGADSITIHLREDRRHIQDYDLREIQSVIPVPLNLEMALAPEIILIALRHRPEKVCIVPERRQELTTEGGMDIVRNEKCLRTVIPEFHRRKIEVSLFVEPSPTQLRASARVGADAVEIHTGAYANAKGIRRRRELHRI
ncbi:MAG: pyridoxine 5'-phosphate synthase, partial [Candidatus Omnitrophica bacterium]|nr:pyridoxine 5'-phosphate synthase [Candidatus Omnitrophota bacterium]